MPHDKHGLFVYTPFIIFAALIALSFFIAKPFLLTIFLSGLMAYTIYPIYKRMNAKWKRPSINSLTLTTTVLLLIVLPAGYLVNTIVKQSYVIYLITKQRLASGLFRGCNAQICETFTNFIQIPDVALYIERASNAVTQFFITNGSELIFIIPTIIINLFVFHFLLFYFLKDGENGAKRIGYYLSVQKKKYAQIVLRLQQVTYGVVYGYILIAILQGILGGLGFWIVGISSPVFWGVIMAILALIPYVGTGIIWAPAALYLIINGLGQNDTFILAKGIGLLIYGLFIVSSVDNILRPKIISDKAKIHPGIIIIGILGGMLLFGPFGVIIGPMVLSLTSIIFEVYMGDKPTKHQIKKVLKHHKES